MQRYKMNRKVVEVDDDCLEFRIEKQPHKRGGWCKWSDVNKLIDENIKLIVENNKLKDEIEIIGE